MDGGLGWGMLHYDVGSGLRGTGGPGEWAQKTKNCKPQTQDRSNLTRLTRLSVAVSPSTAQHTMADEGLPAWINKPASEASAEEKKAFVDLGKDDSNLPVMKAALERDPGWAVVKDNQVRVVFVVMIDVVAHRSFRRGGRPCTEPPTRLLWPSSFSNTELKLTQRV